MKVNIDSLKSAKTQVLQVDRVAQDILSVQGGVISGRFSPLQMLSETGVIHGRIVDSDPASARATVEKFREQLEWISHTLQRNAEAFETQDLVAATSLDTLRGIEETAMPVNSQPEPGWARFSFIHPTDSIGTNFGSFVGQLISTQLLSLNATSYRWSELGRTIANVSDQLDNVADNLEHSNDSDATAAAAAKIRHVAGSGRTFVDNAHTMARKLDTLFPDLMKQQVEAAADYALIQKSPPQVRPMLERAALAKHQGQLYQAIVASLPYQQSLMEPIPATGGGDITTGMDDASPTHRAGQFPWPDELLDLVQQGALTPETFTITDGQLAGVNGVPELSEKAMGQLARTVADGVADLYHRAGLTPPAVDAGAIGTTQAGLPATHGTGPGAMPGITASAGPLAGMSTHGVTTTGGVNPALPVVGGPGHLGQAGLGAGSSMLGVSGTVGAVATGGIGAGGFGAGGIGTGGPGGAHGATGAGQSAAGGNARGTSRASMPMTAMGAPATAVGGRRGRIKSVTSQVEISRNKRALLGEPKPVIPGVISDWVRR